MFFSLISATAGEVFTYIGYILLALVALMIMIVVHESGHYLAGKMLGFKIDEFGIGFGPPIIKKTNKKRASSSRSARFRSAASALFTVKTRTASRTNALSTAKNPGNA